jgi:hypothetical protein
MPNVNYREAHRTPFCERFSIALRGKEVLWSLAYEYQAVEVIVAWPSEDSG